MFSSVRVLLTSAVAVAAASVSCGGAILLALSGVAQATTTLKIGTLAPQDSPWGKEFKEWASEVAADTNGEMQLDFQWSGVAGDEVLMVQKIRSGQLDGAALTAVGLAQTGVTDVLLFQMPGLFADWANLDTARNAMMSDFEKWFAAKGFTVAGWGDVGAAKTMTVGFEVHRTGGLRGKGCYAIVGDPVQPRIFAEIGAITPRVVTVAEILPDLASGAVNVVVAPPLAAEELHWASSITHISSQTVDFRIGALILSSARLLGIPQNLRNIVTTRGNQMSARLTASIRTLDAQAYARLRSSKVSYNLTPAEKKEWSDLFSQVRQELRRSVFTPSVFDRIVQLANAMPPPPLVPPPPSPAPAPDPFEVALNQCVMRARAAGGAEPAVCHFQRPLDQMDFGQLHCNARCAAEAGLDTHRHADR
ncbi:MAG: TRAP transporter substrate-binding protein DctP [Polyangiaceae bacterium]